MRLGLHPLKRCLGDFLSALFFQNAWRMLVESTWLTQVRTLPRAEKRCESLTDFVAINSGVNAGRTTSANLSLVENGNSSGGNTVLKMSFHSCHPFSSCWQE
jgi:hypothetical protein